jgi:alkyldihydroxyacetonephosphate synthase
MVVSTEVVQRWGGGGHGVPVTLQEFLADRGMGAAQPRPALDLAAVEVRASRIAAERDLAGLGCAYEYDDLVRLRCSGGFSFIDLCHRRWPDSALPAVDVVLLPRTHDDVRRILDAAREKQWAVVPFGGGTSVVDGVDVTERPTVGVAFWEMNCGAGPGHRDRRGACAAGHHRSGARAVARGAGLHVGAHPAVLGACDRRGLCGHALGGTDLDRVRSRRRHGDQSAGRRAGGGLRSLGKAPGTAAGPDLRQVFLGSEGRLRDHHRDRAAGASAAGEEGVRGVCCSRVSRRASVPSGNWPSSACRRT